MKVKSYSFTVRILDGTPILSAMEDLFELCVHLGCAYQDGIIHWSQETPVTLRVFPQGHGVLFNRDQSIERWYARDTHGHWMISARQNGWKLHPDGNLPEQQGGW